MNMSLPQKNTKKKSQHKKKSAKCGAKDKGTEMPVQKKNREVFSGSCHEARENKTEHEISCVVQGVERLNLAEDSRGTTTPVAQHRKPVIYNMYGLTNHIAIDCEMVGTGCNGKYDMLARVSIVNKIGVCIYDKFVKARREVTDYRTHVSGIRKSDLKQAEDIINVRNEVAGILRGRILIGHSLKCDMKVLALCHPYEKIRDTSKYHAFRKITNGLTPSLKTLAKEVLGIDIQDGEHSSVEDAAAAMRLYCAVADKWEAVIENERNNIYVLHEEYY